MTAAPFAVIAAIKSKLDDRAQIAINGLDQTLGGVGNELWSIYSKQLNKNLFINASPKLPYGDVVAIIDIAKGAGVGDINLIINQEDYNMGGSACFMTATEPRWVLDSSPSLRLPQISNKIMTRTALFNDARYLPKKEATVLSRIDSKNSDS